MFKNILKNIFYTNYLIKKNLNKKYEKYFLYKKVTPRKYHFFQKLFVSNFKIPQKMIIFFSKLNKNSHVIFFMSKRQGIFYEQ